MNAATLFFEKFEFAPSFKQLHLGGNGWLGDEEFFGCLGKTEVLRNTVEDPEMIEIEHLNNPSAQRNKIV
ncbi:hypothetical protein DESC_120110 [Desulfosarcina cetonica]|nr:hypothetical protein [Desulfosarcina cetonica]VTR64018.1 hypothetical protein DESC_120110 [Desulfosarcina cetonica]